MIFVFISHCRWHDRPDAKFKLLFLENGASNSGVFSTQQNKIQPTVTDCNAVGKTLLADLKSDTWPVKKICHNTEIN